MEHSNDETGIIDHSMLDALDQTLLKHLERITGTREGIQGLTMNLVTVACIVLMFERGQQPGDPQDKENHYRLSEFREELAEMGFSDDRRLQKTLESMTEKGYLIIDPGGGIVPGKPVESMARLLDHVFPGMPGMNLVAYFVQTLDEVETGRRDAKDAVVRLDQMLRRHGATPFGQPSKKSFDTAKPAEKPEKKYLRGTYAPQTPKRLTIPDDIRLPAQEEPAVEEETPSERTIPEATVVELAAEPMESPDVPEEVCGDREPVDDSEIAGAVPPMADSHQGRIESILKESATENPPEPHKEPMLEEESEVLVGEPGEDPGMEEAVDEKVAAFEERLAMQCPVCRMNSIEARKTAKGQPYYKCNDDQCMFISWGRPHHVPCPLCGNPFLVEASSGAEASVLKCPRATCRYIDDPSNRKAAPEEETSRRTSLSEARPRKRVVRRRVRRKKR